MDLTLGASVSLTATFRGLDSNVIDPTSVTAKVWRKDAELADLATYTYPSAELTRLEAGVYRLIFTPDEAGLWYWRFEGGGTPSSAEEGYFRVGASRQPTA